MQKEFEDIYTENAPIVYLFLIKLGCSADMEKLKVGRVSLIIERGLSSNNFGIEEMMI